MLLEFIFWVIARKTVKWCNFYKYLLEGIIKMIIVQYNLIFLVAYQKIQLFYYYISLFKKVYNLRNLSDYIYNFFYIHYNLQY